MKTKIIGTLGPSSDNSEIIAGLIESGMDIARMNFSHCTREEFLRRKQILAEESGKFGKSIKIMQDLQGPRIRVGELPVEGKHLEKGGSVTFSASVAEGSIFIDSKSLLESISVGHPMYLSSGQIELIVREANGATVVAEVVRGGVLFSRKGVNVPETTLSLSGPTEKDLDDVSFALSQGVDYIAVSFVQTADDIRKLKSIVGNQAKIIAKIESAVALKNIDAIIQESDAIMIARGDLGVEIPLERVPFVQKHLIKQSIWHKTGTIVATQMLLSMVENPEPTRAEVSDIANAILDGADAVMLSDETASGKFPLSAMETMSRIARETEALFFNAESYL
jgi:pyruvate kinase